ncbi:hypothetical protein DFP73DRAFT_479885 [Morchella snyderi]|nr:hypothetical protein DFP73DRAFT_479885 [Morchella snyderi]
MSGISTIAIKDGHEGHRPSGDAISAADRISRLSGYFDQARTIASYTPTPTSAPATPAAGTTPGERRSPASNATGSTITTEEALRATREAKMIDGMTYDEGVVDTTDCAPLEEVQEVVGWGGWEREKERERERRRLVVLARAAGGEEAQEKL